MRSLAVLALLTVSCTCGGRAAPPPATPSARLTAGRATSPVVIDGELDEVAWRQAVRSPQFDDSLGHKAPYTDLTVMADDDALYLSVYVADEDLRSDGDRVTLDIGPLKLVLNPKGGVVPAGVQLATDIDGVVDDSKDDDEEWVTEIRIPRALLKAQQVPIRALRIDAGRRGRPHALAWPREGTAILELPPVQRAM